MRAKLFAALLVATTFLTCIVALNLSASTELAQTRTYGYLNKTGEVVIKPGFQIATSFAEGLAAVTIGDKWGYIDKTGKQVIKPQFSGADSFCEGLAAVNMEVVSQKKN